MRAVGRVLLVGMFVSDMLMAWGSCKHDRSIERDCDTADRLELIEEDLETRGEHLERHFEKTGDRLEREW